MKSKRNQSAGISGQIGGIEIKSRPIDEKARLLKNEVQKLWLKINTSFKIQFQGIQEELNDMERRVGIICIQINAVEIELMPLAKKIMPVEGKMKTHKKRIGIIQKTVKRSIANIMIVERKMKVIRKKLSTASPQNPFIKHYKFSVTR